MERSGGPAPPPNPATRTGGKTGAVARSPLCVAGATCVSFSRQAGGAAGKPVARWHDQGGAAAMPRSSSRPGGTAGVTPGIPLVALARALYFLPGACAPLRFTRAGGPRITAPPAEYLKTGSPSLPPSPPTAPLSPLGEAGCTTAGCAGAASWRGDPLDRGGGSHRLSWEGWGPIRTG